MMEGMNQSGQEEYIWAMRTSAYRESDSDLWKIRRPSSMVESSQSQLRGKEKSTINMGEDRQAKVIASLVPDEVIYNYNDYSHRTYDACFLFGDVSGFTELCEKYNKTGVSGPSRMTQVLNKYLGAMVQEVLSHNGDVLKFSGDAFLAMFKGSENETMRDSVHEALDCALVIQKSYGQYETDVGVIIRVKLAISAGPVMFSLIGTPNMSHYVVVGKPIWDVKAAESISTAGDIIVSPAAWHYVSTNEYLAQDMPDGIHIKLLGVGANWRSVQKNVKQKVTKSPSEELSQDDDSSSSSSSGITSIAEAMNEEFSLRPAVNVATKMHIKKDLRKFIIAPVMKSIDMDEPFEYLTEMRQSVIVFINVVSTKLETEDTVILADETYKIVCSVVDQMQGCVNKVSLFDKDLMFVVIFGLRGLKHELECQIALRCARECHLAINKLPGVLSASIGVTTGKCYCGVFGHTLRREYTVISLIVNKAARLMVAYKNKVTCDRETFLHSKMEAKNFILQEPKHLKGITHPGPVYEFIEVDVSRDAGRRINRFPLLGREDKIKLYLKLLEKSVESSADNGEEQYKMLLIQAEARVGKTRLLDEIIFCTPSKIPVSRFTLTIKDNKLPYHAMKLLFSVPLDLANNVSQKQREARIIKILRKSKNTDIFCALNGLFGVKFKISDYFMGLSIVQKEQALRKILKELCHCCFVSMWVIAIDDAEFIDDDSWELLDELLSVNKIFIVATMGRFKITLSETAEKLLKDKRIKTIILQPIDRWYHGALACQILDVYAIPAELEKVIQARSNGNPGWIESFLISMIQDDGLYILKADLRQINDLGLVCPPLYMMTRMNKEEVLEWKHIMEERRPSMDSLTEDYWTRYIDSCRDSYLNVTVREKMEAKGQGGKVPVCVLSPSFNVADVESELSMDVVIMKTFDSLISYEQLLIKCSAILGNQFPRDMLLYVMSATSQRQAALAVKKLFEIKVLSCAKGDFTEGGVNLKERLQNPGDDEKIKCECRGLKVHETLLDLPRFACCGYMQFRSSMFRDITYNLLTDNQKKEFHNRAIRYLEKETRRCKACGNGFFDRILGTKHEDDFLYEKERKKQMGSLSESYDDISINTAPRRSSVFSTGTQISFEKRRKENKYDGHSLTSAPSGILSENSKVEKALHSFFGFTLINRLKNSFSLTRAFSQEDFTDCQCNLILSTTYAQLVEHCKGAGDLNKLLDAMMEYSYICIISFNIPLAMRILNESLLTLEEVCKENHENVWKLSLIRGKIYMLIGYSKLEMALLDEALINLHTALAQYNIKFPKNNISKQLRTCSFQMKQLFGLYIFPRTLNKNLDHWETVFSNNLSECLSHFCTVYMAQNKWKNAELAATWSLSRALASFSDFRVTCTAYANMIYVAQHAEKWNLCIALEVHALRLCQLKKARVEAEELKAVAKLYSIIFSSRIFRCNMEKSIHIGYIVLRISTTVHALKILLPLLPLLMHALLMGKHTSNAISILQELDYFSDEDSDNSGKVWYFALCICFHLETGYTSLPYNVCEKFYQIEGENWVTIRDPDAIRRYYTVMWLWCIRNEKWEAAALWCIQIKDNVMVSDDDSLSNKLTALYLLEGLILFLVCKMDRHNIQAVIKAENEISQLFKMIEQSARVTQIILPRLYHLKAYYRFVKHNDNKVFDLLHKAKKYAEKFGNTLEVSWIEHSVKAWTRNMPAVTVSFWREHCEPDNGLDYHELEINAGKLGFFTLPTPLYM